MCGNRVLLSLCFVCFVFVLLVFALSSFVGFGFFFLNSFVKCDPVTKEESPSIEALACVRVCAATQENDQNPHTMMLGVRPLKLLILAAALLGLCTRSLLAEAGAKMKATRTRHEDEGDVPLTDFETTLDAKVMPTGRVPEGVINPYVTSSKLVTKKRTILVSAPPAVAEGGEASQIEVSVSRYDTFDDIMQQVEDKLGVKEGDGAWRLVSATTGQTLQVKDLGWLADGSNVRLVLPGQGDEHLISVRTISVLRNGEVDGGVNYRLTPHDTCASVIEATGRDVGIDKAHMDDDPQLFDEGGLRLTDADLGWLDDGAKVWIVPSHRYYLWPKYDVGQTIRIQHPESPIPGKQIELTTLSNTPKLIQIDNFMSDEEMQHLIDRASERLEQSVTGANADGTHTHRTSTNAWESNTAISKRLIHRAFSLARVPYVCKSGGDCARLQVFMQDFLCFYPCCIYHWVLWLVQIQRQPA